MTTKKSQAMQNIQARADAVLADKAARGEQPDLFACEPLQGPIDINPAPAPETVQSKGGNKRTKLLPVRHVERDFFLCDMFDYALT
jgi:hypothetical protein